MSYVIKLTRAGDEGPSYVGRGWGVQVKEIDQAFVFPSREAATQRLAEARDDGEFSKQGFRPWIRKNREVAK